MIGARHTKEVVLTILFHESRMVGNWSISVTARTWHFFDFKGTGTGDARDAVIVLKRASRVSGVQDEVAEYHVNALEDAEIVRRAIYLFDLAVAEVSDAPRPVTEYELRELRAAYNQARFDAAMLYSTAVEVAGILDNVDLFVDANEASLRKDIRQAFTRLTAATDAAMLQARSNATLAPCGL